MSLFCMPMSDLDSETITCMVVKFVHIGKGDYRFIERIDTSTKIWKYLAYSHWKL